MYPPEYYRDHLELMTESELAAALDVKVSTLATWRFEGQGPKYTKLGKSIYYRRCDIQEWMEQCVVVPEEQGRRSRRAKARGAEQYAASVHELESGAPGVPVSEERSPITSRPVSGKPGSTTRWLDGVPENERPAVILESGAD